MAHIRTRAVRKDDHYLVNGSKMFITSGVQVTYDAVQIHGGFGCMREYLLERLYRDNRILSIGGDTQEIMKEIISKFIV